MLRGCAASPWGRLASTHLLQHGIQLVPGLAGGSAQSATGIAKRSMTSLMAMDSVPAVPRYPILGSLPQIQSLKDETGAPVDSMNRFETALALLTQQKGEIFSMGLPGTGDGLTGRVIVCSNPAEYLKIIQSEGVYPSGAVQAQWPTKLAMKAAGSKILDFFEQGEEWRKYRTLMQRGLLPPAVSKGYLPGIAKACELASRGAPSCASEMNKFSTRCSFDIFCTVMFGQLTETADPATPSSPGHAQFCSDVVAANDLVFPMMASPLEYVLNMLLGVRTTKANMMADYFRKQYAYSSQLIEAFLERRDKGELNEFESKSYLAMTKLKQVDSEVGEAEFMEICQLLLFAAVDTTSSVLNWAFVQLAINQEAQERLAAELQGQDIVQALSKGKSQLPYLHAVLRESHRVQPSLPISLFKRTQQDTEMCGYNIPKGTTVMLDGHSLQRRPDLVPEPEKFKPERWLSDAVAARAGTDAEIIDHPLMHDPFSAGARKCPGSRVANLEAMCMIAQLVKDWKFELADKSLKSSRDVGAIRVLTIQPSPMPEFVFSRRTA